MEKGEQVAREEKWGNNASMEIGKNKGRREGGKEGRKKCKGE